MALMRSDELEALSAAVQVARIDVVAARSLPTGNSGHPSGFLEQRELWRAMESFAAALLQCGYPVPHELSRELQVYRCLFAPHSRLANRV